MKVTRPRRWPAAQDARGTGRTRDARPAGRARGLAVLAAVAALTSGCALAAGQSRPAAPASPGPGEGTLQLLGVSGYVQDGTVDPRADWVTAFEQRTGCQVSFTGVPSVNAIQRALASRNQDYDGVLAPPALAGQLIGSGGYAPLDVRLIHGYTAIHPALRARDAVISGGKIYGLPYLWTSYVLGYQARSVRPAPAGWAAVFGPVSAARYKGKIMLPDTPLTFALAALYLESARPALRITDPYELTSQQFAAVVSLMKSIRSSVTTYSADSDVIGGLASGSAVLGAVLPRHVDALARAGRTVAGAAPAEGTTGSVSFWLVNAHAPHPNCMYQWLDWSITPWVQQQASQWTGTARVAGAGCDALGRPVCSADHTLDQAYLSKVAFAHLPRADCGGGSRDCATWVRWEDAWTSLVRATSG